MVFPENKWIKAPLPLRAGLHHMTNSGVEQLRKLKKIVDELDLQNLRSFSATQERQENCRRTALAAPEEFSARRLMTIVDEQTPTEPQQNPATRRRCKNAKGPLLRNPKRIQQPRILTHTQNPSQGPLGLCSFPLDQRPASLFIIEKKILHTNKLANVTKAALGHR